jgi:hypothetical protein
MRERRVRSWSCALAAIELETSKAFLERAAIKCVHLAMPCDDCDVERATTCSNCCSNLLVLRMVLPTRSAQTGHRSTSSSGSGSALWALALVVVARAASPRRGRVSAVSRVSTVYHGLVSRLVSPTERLSGVEQHPSSNFSRPEAELPADTRQRTAKLPICFGAAKNRTSHASSLRIERWRHRLTQLEGAHHSEARRRTI